MSYASFGISSRGGHTRWGASLSTFGGGYGGGYGYSGGYGGFCQPHYYQSNCYNGFGGGGYGGGFLGLGINNHHTNINIGVRSYGGGYGYEQQPRVMVIDRPQEYAIQQQQPVQQTDVLAQAIRQASNAANLIDSNPDFHGMDRRQVAQIQAQARYNRDNVDGQNLVGHKNDFPFLNSNEAVQALDKAYQKTQGDPERIAQVEQAWMSVKPAHRGAQRDGALQEQLADLQQSWGDKDLLKGKTGQNTPAVDPKTGETVVAKAEAVIKDNKSLVAESAVLFDGQNNDRPYLVSAAAYLKQQGIDTSKLDAAINGKGDFGLSKADSLAFAESISKVVDAKNLTDDQKKQLNDTLAQVSGHIQNGDAPAISAKDAERVAAVQKAISSARTA